jgi:Holliday junction resolvase RusA-like endonuclease
MTEWNGNGRALEVDEIERLTFWVEGTPVPQGSHSVFNGHVVDSNKGLKGWRGLVTGAALTALAGRDGFAKEDEVYVLLDFYMPRGRTVKRRRPTVKPDLDKLVRAILDALTASHMWVDDGQVVSIHTQQFYADDQPGVQVVVGRLA